MSRFWLFRWFARGFNHFSLTEFFRSWFSPDWYELLLFTCFKLRDRIQFCLGSDPQGGCLFKVGWLSSFICRVVQTFYLFVNLSLSGWMINQVNRYGSERLVKLIKWNSTITVQVYSPHNVWKLFFDRFVTDFDKKASNRQNVDIFVVGLINGFEAVTQIKIGQSREVFLLLLNSQ